MGRQHGTQEGLDGKIPLTQDIEGPYWPAVSQLRYGDCVLHDLHLFQLASSMIKFSLPAAYRMK